MISKSPLFIICLFYSSLYCMHVYFWDGTQYKEDSEPQYQIAMKIIENSVKPLLLSKEMNVLDVGCGTGRVTEQLAKYAAQIKGIDAKKNMIDYANEHKEVFNNLVFEVIDVTQLKEKETYDLIFSSLCIHWIEEDQKQQALCAIAQSMKPDGQFIGSVSIKNDNNAMMISFMEVAHKRNLLNLQAKRNINNRMQEDDVMKYKRLFANAGLSYEFIKGEETYYFSHQKHLLNWLKPLFKSSLKRLNVDTIQHNEFLHEIIDTYVNKIDAQKNGIYYALPLLVFKAHKNKS